jgi:O-antigen/teichoic acid export membrane protein
VNIFRFLIKKNDFASVDGKITGKQTSYRNVVKATSIFGGVQAYQIFINLVKAKFVALFLGVVGMGISGLFVSTLAIVFTIAGLGISFSATREVSQASHEEDLEKLNKIYTIFSHWLYFASFLGFILVIVFSSLFSRYAFGNQDYTWAFMWLSITVIFNILTGGNNTLLQGSRRLKDMAKSSVVGSTFGLITSIPLYYFFGIKGIVPALIFGAVSSFFVSYYYVHKMKLNKITLTIKETFTGGSEMVKLGIVIMIASLVGAVVTFGVNAFISHIGSVADVGLYNAGIAITSQYVGLVFTAMAMDYFPRLSAISSENIKVCEVVNQQSEITILIVLPLLVAMILTAPLLIKILLTSEFLKITTFVRIIAVGTIFQAAGYTISYIPLAKGDKNTYFLWNAFVGNLLGLILLPAGYMLYGLNGLAVTILIHHTISFFVFILITKRKYNYSMDRSFIFLLCSSVVFIVTIFIIMIFCPNIVGYSIGSILLLLSILFSIYYLDKLINMKEWFSNLLSSVKAQ